MMTGQKKLAVRHMEDEQMKFYLCNAFSINMLSRVGQAINFVPVHPAAVSDLLENEEWESAIGHPDMPALIAEAIAGGVREVPHIEMNRINVGLSRDTSLIVAQYRGPRLQEGATSLPEGAKIEFWQVYLA